MEGIGSEIPDEIIYKSLMTKYHNEAKIVILHVPGTSEGFFRKFWSKQ